MRAIQSQQREDLDELILSELTAIKRLAIFALTRWGATQGEIGKALGIDQSNVSRMMQPINGKKRKRNGG